MTLPTRNYTRRNRTGGRRQSGALIIEVMIAILIFSVGILGVVGLQAAAVKASTDAKYRSEAGLLANELISKMWVSDRTQATLQAAFSSTTSGAAYVAWLGSASVPGSVLQVLPGISATVNRPTVEITANNSTSLPSSDVVITLYWQSPEDATVHNYKVVAQIGG